LSEKGILQAERLADDLADAGIDLLWSSPHVRCRQTLHPLMLRLDLPVAEAPFLAEGAGGTVPLDRILEAAAEGHQIAACSHGDVIPAIVAQALGRGAVLVGPVSLAKAARYELEIGPKGVTRITHLPAPDLVH